MNLNNTFANSTISHQPLVSNLSVVSVTPVVSPTPPDTDLLQTLCTKASREVEGNRIIIDAQKQYIDILEKKDVVSQDIMKGQSVLLKEYQDAVKDLKTSNSKADEIIANKDKEIGNLKKEVEIAKAHKCGFICQASRIGLGVGIGIVLH